MNEIEAPRAEAGADAAEVTGFGRRLAAERAKLGLSVEEVAARLRLHPKQIHAIEIGNLPALPAPFLRGFVRNYAKEVRLDPAPLVDELNAMLGMRAGGPPPMATNRSAGAVGAPSGHGSRSVVVIGVIAALVAFAVLGGLATRSEKPRADPAVEAAKPPARPAAPAQGPPATSEQKAEPAASAPTGTSAQPSPMPVPASSPIAEPLRLSFRDQSWVEVTQADGKVVLSQINAGGTEQRIEGKPPLRLVIGNASAVALDYKGKVIDLKPVTNAENVARITLN
jgi:cytoskeleton protein RodZ